jgi:hypothetical protein
MFQSPICDEKHGNNMNNTTNIVPNEAWGSIKHDTLRLLQAWQQTIVISAENNPVLGQYVK